MKITLTYRNGPDAGNESETVRNLTRVDYDETTGLTLYRGDKKVRRFWDGKKVDSFPPSRVGSYSFSVSR